jgi:hypothetical protein
MTPAKPEANGETWSDIPPTEPGLYDVDTHDFDGAYWTDRQVTQVGKKLFIDHPKFGKRLNVAGCHGWLWKKSSMSRPYGKRS